jgi:hypothetical protein
MTQHPRPDFVDDPRLCERGIRPVPCRYDWAKGAYVPVSRQDMANDEPHLPPDVPRGLPDRSPRWRWWRRLIEWLAGPACVVFVASRWWW